MFRPFSFARKKEVIPNTKVMMASGRKLSIEVADVVGMFDPLRCVYNVLVKRRRNAQHFYVRWRAAGPERT
jgi:hypothetical protein